MLEMVKKMASLKFTLLGMVLLLIGASLSYGNPMDTPVWVLVVPMFLMALNLTAAIATNKRINQQPGLLVFHVCLLLIVVLAAVGRMTHMDAHLEIVSGTEFSSDKLLEVDSGPWHSNSLDKVHFVQGFFTVQYAPGMKRGLTHSHIKVLQPGGEWVDKIVGDDRPLVIEGYRFYTTFNKGFSPVLTWLPDNGVPVTGTVNMPSYPLFEYKQDNRWQPPGSEEQIKFWLQLKTGMKEDEHWVLDGRRAKGTLIVTTDGNRHELGVGESVRLLHGTLRFESMTTWMGYRLFYDPTIQWLFVVSICGVFGLAHYLWQKTNLQPWMSETPDPLLDDQGKPLVGDTGLTQSTRSEVNEQRLQGGVVSSSATTNEHQAKNINVRQVISGEQH